MHNVYKWKECECEKVFAMVLWVVDKAMIGVLLAIGQ